MDTFKTVYCVSTFCCLNTGWIKLISFTQQDLYTFLRTPEFITSTHGYIYHLHILAPLGDIGTVLLAKALSDSQLESSLESLAIVGSGIRDLGIRALVPLLARMPNLLALDLSDNDISEEASGALTVTLLRNSKIKLQVDEALPKKALTRANSRRVTFAI
jgi:hypothetical protein